MSNQFTEPTISGFDASPPSDDGANTASNEITWAGIKSKLATPLKNYVDSLVSNVTTAFTYNHLSSTTAKSSAYTVATSDRGTLFLCTNSWTLDLLACSTAGDGFSFAVRNDGSGTITLDGNSSETINGSTTQALYAGWTAVLVTDGSAWYMYSGLGDADGTFTIAGLTTTGNVSIGGDLSVTGTPTFSTPIPVANGGTGVNSWPGFRSYISGAQAITNGSYVKAQFDTESYDVTNDFDSTTNYRFTPSVAGLYLVSVGINWASTEDTKSYFISIQKNATVDTVLEIELHASGTDPLIMNGSAIINMNGSTDYLEVYVYNGGTVSKNIGGSGNNRNFFCSSWIGPSS